MTAAGYPLPADVRWTRLLAKLLVLGLGAWLVKLALVWGFQHPVFDLKGIRVVGPLRHHDAVSLRAYVAPRLRGNFFTIDLAAARLAFESVPWVRRAVVRREFPNRLRVELEEHEAVAFWGDGAQTRLLNRQGEVFDAPLDDGELQGLPSLSGPLSRAPEVLAFLRATEALWTPLEAQVVRVDLSGRGSWRVHTHRGTVVDLGAGSLAEIQWRIQRFVRTARQAAGQLQRTLDALELVDLRYPEGYALRMRGVGTSQPAASAPAARKPPGLPGQ